MTKDEASDLKSLHERIVQLELEADRNKWALIKAKSDYDSLIYRLQHPQAQKEEK